MQPQGTVQCLTLIMQGWREASTVKPGWPQQRHRPWACQCLTVPMQEWLEAVHRGTPQAACVKLLEPSYLAARTAAQ